jgi:hypothetical protein
MNTKKLSLVLGAIALATGLALAACSSNDNGGNPGPTAHDAGTTNQPDTSVPPTTDGGSQEDTGPGIDASLPDVGACQSDSSTCNSCYAPKDDPVNGCSPYTVNCIKFDNTRVPAGSQQ